MKHLVARAKLKPKADLKRHILRSGRNAAVLLRNTITVDPFSSENGAKHFDIEVE